MRKLKLAVLVSALSMACVAQAELTPSETFKQLSPTAVDKLKVSNIDVNALLKNNSNDLMVELSETAYPKITTAEKQA